MKKLLYKAIEKCQIKVSRRALGSSLCLINYMGEKVMDNFGSLSISPSLFYFNFVMNPRKKKYGLRTPTAESPPPPYEPIRF